MLISCLHAPHAAEGHGIVEPIVGEQVLVEEDERG